MRNLRHPQLPMEILNCPNCLELHTWNAVEFLAARSSAEKIEIMLCRKCHRAKPHHHYEVLKQKTISGLISSVRLGEFFDTKP